MSAENYNRRSMSKYGWDATDIGLPIGADDEDVYKRVKVLQTEWGVEVDGKVGPVTVRRVLSLRDDRLAEEGDTEVLGHIVVGGVSIPVDFRAVPIGPYAKMSLVAEGDYSPRRMEPNLVVWHWDATLSAKRCHRVLAARDVSSHGCIDNDGTFYQFLDFKDHVAWHAGHRYTNNRSVGIDVSNAVYTKFQKRYEKQWGPRPIMRGVVVNGHKYPDFLGYYPQQLATARSLAKFIEEHMGIPRETPAEANVLKDNLKTFEGHVAHYHIKKRKWDVAGFDFDYVLGKKDEV